MGNSLWGSLALLGLWFTVGVIYYIFQRDRRRSKQRLADVELELALWVEEQRRQGASATAIADNLEKKRLELTARGPKR
jgi:hypothetical protein